MTSSSLRDPAIVAARVADQLESDGIRYAIGGALALGAHGFPRSTADVDLSVFAPEDDLEPLFDSLERCGCMFERDRARRSVERIALFTVRCGKVLVDVFVSFHSHHHEALRRRVALTAPDGRARWFLSAEDLAIHKLSLDRPKDHIDLERLFKARGARLDVAYIRSWMLAIAGEDDPRTKRLESMIERFLSASQ